LIRRNDVECLRAIRDERRLSDVPVIMYSADFHFERMKEAMRLGAAEYVAKGTSHWDDFLLLIQKHVREPRGTG
jgi:PleD family two-component response regulator